LLLISLVTSLAFSFAFAEIGQAIGEDDTQIGRIKAKLENNGTLTPSEKDLAWDNGLFEEQVAPPAYYIASDLRTAYLEEGFETWPPVGWTLDPATGDGAWLQGDGTTHGPGSVVDGTSAAWFNDYDYSSGTAGSMTSPAIDLSSATAPRLVFWYWDSGSSDAIDVLASTDGTTFTSVYTTPTAVTPWTETIVDLTTYAGNATVYIKFAATSVWGTSNPHVDAFSVLEAPTDPIIGLSAAALDLGGVILGMSSDAVLTISNTGGADLNITDISADNAAFTVDVATGVVAPNATLDVTVTFTPTASMDYTADLSITSDDAGSPAVVALTGSGAPTSGGPDAGGYAWVNSVDAEGPTFAWIDTVGATDAVIANGDDYRGTIDLPFEFRFYGNIYTQITATTNGWIGMGPSTGYSSSYWTNTVLPSSTSPDNIIAPLWDDFKAGDAPGSTSSSHGTIKYITLGTEPNRKFVVIFDEIVRGSSDTDYFSFEVILDEATSDITMQYLDVIGNSSANNGVGGTIGLENADATIGLEYSYNGSPQMVYDETAIHFIAPPPPSLPNMVLDMMTLDFGTVPAGGSAQADIMITNNGSGDLVVSGATVAAPFSTTFSGTIAENSSATATVSFDPAAAGNFAETLTFNVTGEFTGDNTVAVSGGAFPADFVLEDFEGLNFPPNGWMIVDVDGGSAINPALSYIDPFSGEVAAEGMGCADDYLITPALTIPAGYADYSFWVGQESVSYQNSFEIMVSTTGTATTDFVQVADFPMYTRGATDWTMESVDLSAYAGQEVYVAMHVYYSESQYYGFGFDDILMPPLAPTSNTPFFSEYIEGSSNNKAVEIYNATGAEIDLSDYAILRYNNGATTGADSTSLTGTLAADDVYVIANASAIAEILALSDETGTVTYYNGDDHLALIWDANGDDVFDIATEVIDVIGLLGEDPGSAWDVAGVVGATGEHTLMRKPTILTGNADWATSAGTTAEDSEWLVFEQNYWYGLGSHNQPYSIPGDDCSMPFALTLPVVGEAGSSDGFADDYSLSSTSYMNGIDIVYAFSIPEDGSISGSIVDGGGQWTSMIVLDACPDDVEVEVIAQGSGSSGGSFADEAISAGDYFLVISNWPTPNDFTYTFDLSYMVGPPPMVDFIVSDMWSSSDTVYAEVTNQGDANSQGWIGGGTDYHGWFLDNEYLGYATGPALAAGASEVFILTGFNWDALGAGTFEAGFMADVDNDTEESDETNNFDSLDVTIAYPPLVPRNLEASAMFTSISLNWNPAPPAPEVATRGLNLGTARSIAVANDMAKPSRAENAPEILAMKQAAQAEITAFQMKTASSTRDLREVGDTCEDPLALTLPAVAMTGASTGFANDYTGGLYMGGIDIVYAFSIPETGGISGDIVDAGYEYTGMFVFDGCPDAGGAIIAQGTGSSGGSFANVPIGAGDYFLVVSNWPTPNEFTYTLNLTFTAGAVPAPDFVVSDMWLDGTTVYAEVTNQGDMDSPGYFGTDYHGWSLDGSYLGASTGPALAAGAIDTFALEGFEYANLGSGTFVVQLEADVDGDVAESDETNNIATLDVVIDDPDYVPAFNIYRNDVLIVEGLAPVDFAFNGAYIDGGLEPGDYCYTITQDLADETESGASNEACASVTPMPPMDLMGTAADAVVELSWAAPLVVETGWLGYHDGTFENSLASTEGGAGIATLFQPLIYPVSVDSVRFHTSGTGWEMEAEVYLLADDGTTVLDGPYTVNGVEDGWITIDNVDFTLTSGGFMLATYNVAAGGPYVSVDMDHYLGNVYFGHHTTGFSELGSLGFEAVAFHEAYVNYDGTAALLSASVFDDETPASLGTPVKTQTFAATAPERKVLHTNRTRYMGNQDASATRELVGYNVYRGTDPEDLSLVATSTETFYTDLTVENGMTYFYLVAAAYDPEGESLPTNMIALTPLGSVGIPYFSDFEADNGGFNGSGEWEWGVPTFADGPDSAYSVTNLWGTVLDGDHPNYSNSWLILPFDLSTAGGTADLSFAAWFDLETNYDYGYVGIDHDNDGMYDILAEYNGNSGGWIEETLTIPASHLTSYAKIAFIMTSDLSVTNPGLYIDNVSVENTPSGILTGVVTSAYNDATMADALVLAIETTTLAEHGMLTATDGSYMMYLPVGTYEVGFGHEDYFLSELTEVVITLDGTVTLDYAMSPNVSAPSNLMAQETDGGVQLSWDLFSGNEGEEGFESGGIPLDWTTIDVDGDGYNWMAVEGFAHTGDFSVTSESYRNGVGALTPNNFLITPQFEIGEGTTLSFWVGAVDAAWYFEHFKLMLSIAGTNPEDFTVELLDYTLATDAWTEIVVDLSAYAGFSGYVSWVHNEITDVYSFNVDDISVVSGDGLALVSNTFDTPEDLERFQISPFRITEDMTEEEIQVRYDEFENEETSSSLRSELLFFKVYSNVDGAGWNMIGAANDGYAYFDETPLAGQSVEYKVTAQYDIAESDFSNTVQLQVVGVDELGVPNTFALHQNYPNPFNPTTLIRYELPEAAYVRIVVYNVLGQKVATLVDQSMNAGYYDISWSGTNDLGSSVSSGIYLYRIESEKFNAVRKLMYLK